MTDMNMEIDWEQIWSENYEQYKLTMRPDSDDKDYWSRRAEDFSDLRSASDFNFGRQVLSSLWGKVLTAESVVLDVGAGPGTFVIPFARMVKWIDAVEPAPGMVDKINVNAQRDGTMNFGIFNSTWQEVDIASISGRYDLVISSLVLWVFQDVWQQLRRMEQASMGYCCIVTGAGTRNENGDALWRKITDDQEHTWPSIPEYPLIYNILYSKGRLPNVSIVNYTSERSVENKVNHIKLCFERRISVTPEIEKAIREHFHAQSRDGRVQEPGQAAVIWWKAPER